MTNPYYTATGNPGAQTQGRSDVIRAEYALVQVGFDGVYAAVNLKAPLASPALTGTPTAPTPASVADNTTTIATTAFVQSVLGTAGALLPVQATHGGQFLTTNGTTASWATTVPQNLVVQDQKSSGTNGGTSSTGENTRVLNTTIVNTISGASLASNQVSLPAGTYDFLATAPGQGNGITRRLRLYNVTDSAFLGYGPTLTYPGSGSVTLTATCFGRFTLAGTKTIELRDYQSAGTATSGFGSAMSTGETECYATLEIWKVS